VTDAVTPADIDPVDRLTILAAALPGAVVRQRQIAAPFDAVWQVIADLEHATPRYEPGVARMRVIERHGQFLRLLVQQTGGREEMMDAKLRPGWCLMQSATVVVAFAARPVGSQTLLAHLEHQRAQAAPLSQSQSRHRRAAEAKIDKELQTIETLATQNQRSA
jgi:hypothetical protein